MTNKQDQPIQETPIQEMTWDDLLIRREAILNVLENLEAEKQVIQEEFLQRLKDEKINGKVVGNYSISKAVRYSFGTSLEKAREYGAVKESVDQSVLKKLVLKGIEVPDMRKSEYCIVREAKGEE